MAEIMPGFDFEANNLVREVELFKARFLGDPLNPELEGRSLVEYRRASLAEPYQEFAGVLDKLAERYKRVAKDSYRRVVLGPLNSYRSEPIVRFGPFEPEGVPLLQVPFIRYVGDQERPRYICYTYSTREGVGWAQSYRSKWANPERRWGYPRPMNQDEVSYWLRFLAEL